MRPVLTAQQMRAWDSSHIDGGVAGAVLMENAGRGAAHLIGLKLRPRATHRPPRTSSAVAGSCVRCADERSLEGTKVAILCGPGNNGGDGFVVARHLHARAANVTVYGWSSRDKLSGDAAAACRAMEAVGVPWQPLPDPEQWSSVFEESDAIVDALLGTGTTRPIEGQLRDLVEAVNRSSAYVVALDVPTGLDATTGAKLGVTVRADHTVTFGHLKLGLLTTEGHRSAGTITLSHIGVPSAIDEITPKAWLLEEGDVRARVAPRSPVSHKGAAGRVVVVAGTAGTLGAARLSAGAALRAGAGVVTVATHPEAVALLDREVREIMTFPLKPDDQGRNLLASAGALVVGPGLGRDTAASELVRMALEAERPAVVDADALRWLAQVDRSSLGSLSLCVLTPHPAEAAALLECSVADVESDRFAAVERIASRFGATVLLKGSRSIVAAQGRASVVSAFGSPVLSTAGSGDVLCGILASQLTKAHSRDDVFDAVVGGLGLQGLAAQLWSERHGDRGLLASEIGDLVPEIIRHLLEQ